MLLWMRSEIMKWMIKMFSWEKLEKRFHRDFSFFKKGDISLEKVVLKDREMALHFILKGRETGVKAEYDALGLLAPCFPDFTVTLEILSTASPDSPKKWVEQELKSYLPSSAIWLKTAKWKEEEGILALYPPTEESYFSLTQNGFMARVAPYLESQWGLKFSICKDEVCTVPSENLVDFVSKREGEEQGFSRDIQSEQIQDMEEAKKEKIVASPSLEGAFTYGKKKNYELLSMSDVSALGQPVQLEGMVFEMALTVTKNGYYILKLSITDHVTSVLGKIFFNKEEKYMQFASNIKEGDQVAIYGMMEYDTYEKTNIFNIQYLEKRKVVKRQDNADIKRVELHAHTQMSAMDGLIPPKDLIKRAKDFGHRAVAVTDNGVVQGFPDALSAGKDTGIKVLYGLEANVVYDDTPLIENGNSPYDRGTYVVFDLETTGFSSSHDQIIEIGAVKIKEGQVIDSFSQFVNPGRSIPPNIQELTNITDQMVAGEPPIDKVLPKFCDFFEGSVLVAHNASFDIGFIRKNMAQIHRKFNTPYLDTLRMARCLYPHYTKFNLGFLCKKLGISLQNAHRAVDDSAATGELFLKLLEEAENQNLYEKVFDSCPFPTSAPEKQNSYHITILAQNLIGLKNLYHLVSESHLEHFYRDPKIPHSSLMKRREGLLLGSGCEAGLLFQSVLQGVNRETLLSRAKDFDFLEIQPPRVHCKLLERHHVDSYKEIEDINRTILSLGEELGIPVVATGDVRYLNPEDDVMRKVLVMGTQSKGQRGEEEKAFIKKRKESYYFRTTDEMLEEFSFLGPKKAYEVVVENTNHIADLIEDFPAIPEGKFPPFIEGAEEDLRRMSYENAHNIYGNPLPKLIEERLETELHSIISNGYAVMYIIAHQLVKKSNEDGYYVGSRGSVGSSFVATMSNITEVNPLPPHYICPNCKYSEFTDDDSVGSGVDLPDKMCPICGTELKKDGHNIPFEVFLGFHGDKEPDIDLNFAGEYQATAHKYIEELFGEGYVFRAGTIGTLADRTAYGFVLGYLRDMEITPNPAEINRLVKGCVGVRRTSGQHPGGIMICPKSKDIHDFTPIQYPANDSSTGRITTHFDYHSISENILKLDILGHDTPTIIRMLEDFTGFPSDEIKLDDPDTLSLFSGMEVLKADPNIFTCTTGTLGIPEFGTGFVRRMLVETKPKNFSELVRISGLSHGTDVWTDNAQLLVQEGRATLSEVISTREDIMVYLMNAGAPNKMAFDVMEKVRKGKGIPEKYYEDMKKLSLPDWYIESCEKIKYMFPKAHAVAYVMMSFRIAYYKVNYPAAFYASYFSQKLADSNGFLFMSGWEAVRDRIEEIDGKGFDATAKEKSERTVLEVALEMFSRGLVFLPVDLYKSEASKFIPEDGNIRLPLQSLPGLGESVALAIAEEREKQHFLSVEDLKIRTKAGTKVIEALELHGSLKKLPKTNQLDLFSL